MKILKQVNKHNLNLVAVHKQGKVYILFCSDSVYIWGSKKEVDKYIKETK